MTTQNQEDFPDDDGVGFFAERLNRLFKSVHPQDRGPYSTPEAAKLINEAAGQSVISATYLWQLRKGRRSDPTLGRVAAIAALFNVKLDYFNEARREEPSLTELQLAQALQKQPIRELARQADGLSAAGTAALLDLARSLRAIEGLYADDNEGPQTRSAR